MNKKVIIGGIAAVVIVGIAAFAMRDRTPSVESMMAEQARAEQARKDRVKQTDDNLAMDHLDPASAIYAHSSQLAFKYMGIGFEDPNVAERIDSLEKEARAELEAAYPKILGFDGRERYTSEQNVAARRLSREIISKYNARFDTWFREYSQAHPK